MFDKTIIDVENSKPISLEVAHDRYGNLIIKKLRVDGDNLDDVIRTVQEGLREFEEMKE